MEAVNLQHTENEILDFMEDMFPKDMVQCINPYNSNAPVPQGDYYEMHILGYEDIGFNQRGDIEYNKTEDVLEIQYDQLKSIKIQVDFYGDSAFSNCNFFRQVLVANLQNTKGQGIIDIRNVSDIRDLTFLQNDKSFMRRYEFDVEAYIVDSIKFSSDWVNKAEVKIVDRGNLP